MTKFAQFDRATGSFEDTYHGAFCSFETMAALFATEAAAATGTVLATEAFGGAVAAGGLSVPVFAGSTSVGAGGLLANAFSGLTAKDFLSGGFALFSGAQSVNAGQLAAESLRQQALFADISSRQELIKGRKQALDLEALTLDEVEQFTAGVGARGITGSGSSRIARQEAITQSNRQQDFATENAAIRSAAERIRARTLKIDAAAAETTGVLGAAKTAAEFALRRTGRG